MNRSLISLIRKIGASVLFVGYIPVAPGTAAAALVAAGMWFSRDTTARFFTPAYVVQFWIAIVLLITTSIYLARDAVSVFGDEDSKHIVIDECVGQFITFFLVSITWRSLLLGFVLFRFFDIVKPFPVYKFEELDEGIGTVMDDVAAGVMANISLMIIIFLYHAIKSRL